MSGRSKLFVSVFAVVIFASLVVMPTVRVNAASSLPLTFSSGLTLYSPVNTTYTSSVLNCSGSFTGPIKYEILINYTVDGSYQGNLPWKLNSSNAANYTLTWSFQLPKLSRGSHQLSIGIDQQLYSGVTLISQTTHVDTVYFSVNPTSMTAENLVLIILIIAIIVVLGVVLLFYRRHRKPVNLNK